MKNILLLLFISYFIISCSSNTKTPFEEEAYKMLKTEISDTFSSVGNDVDILNASTESVSYTHLTLPTTPYV